MGSPLETLHVELIEQIVTLLEYSDIAALRLTSRVIEAKASNWHFNSFFKIKEIDLTTKNLQRFVQVTEKWQRGCLLQHCTIRGIIRGDAPAVHEDEAEHQRFLSKALHNLKQKSPEKSLVSLKLHVAVLVENSNGDLVRPEKYCNGREVWKAALRTFRLAMMALRESQLPVNEHLNIFGDLRGCSLGYDAFLAEFAPTSTMTREVFRSLKKLTVRLSAPPNLDGVPGECPVAGEYQPPPSAQGGSKANYMLRETLHILPTVASLESVDLHWYTLGEENSLALSTLLAASPQEGDISPDLPHLKECRLQGFYTSETELLNFLTSVRPTKVALTYIRLISGTYTPVFRYLTSPDSQVVSYHLDDLIEDGRLVHFAVPGRPKFPYSAYQNVGPNTLSREGDQINEVIQYRFPRGRALGSPQKYWWSIRKGEDYRASGGRHYDFIKLNPQ